MSKRKGLAILLAVGLGIAALVLPLALSASAPKTIYVAATGKDSPDCGGRLEPCRTIQQAVDLAQANDLIQVAAGHYTSVNTRGGLKQLVYIDKNLYVLGGYTPDFAEPPNPRVNLTTLDAQGQGRVIYVMGNVNVTLEGLRITGGNAAGLMGGLIQEPGRDAGGGIYIITATATISGCEVWDNRAADSGMTGMGGGVYASGGSSVFLIANNIHHNTALASGVMGSGGGYVLRL